MRDAEQFADYGTASETPVVDILKVIERVRVSVEEVHEKKRLFKRLEADGVRVLDGVGTARFAGENSVTLGDGRRLKAEEFI